MILNYGKVDELLFVKREKCGGVKSKIILIITVVSALLSLICGIFEYILPLYLTYKHNISINKNSSVAIIGGADGPTAIYVTHTSANSFPITIIFLLITILGVGYGLFTKFRGLKK
ncbi:hypothetical protein [Pseudobacteroides cellulosolvens]|uniref:Na+transporting methylmalonyl-CoA/oxaloacetate decarboxylase beta subunit n=1 Tax=Pseudobacteroides cellulosolvens ATCC 35603 = DSM 2933 TaxID=398512 RepID=A0A0L6JJL5_9FIRM|nr:hypothetical protein [Pseudobacteroides cellulosolvens]KNY25930.1 Na+transporting methylmalonyl-CoA/oxaloacetate decarboxylase beta subunit [Pseudobacteroides cellulosolvens ATCC 35603 = DSM 2933]